MKNIKRLSLSISCEETSDLAIKIRNHTQSGGHKRINLAEFGIDWDLYVTRWGTEYSPYEGAVLFTVDLSTLAF